MKKLLIVAGAVGVLIAGFCVVVALQPSDYRVTRSAELPAAPAAVFPHVNELRKWPAWSPWAKKDLDAKNTFEGPSSGTGALLIRRLTGNGIADFGRSLRTAGNVRM